MKRLVLAVDDVPTWTAKYRRWVPDELAIIVTANDPISAMRLVRRMRFDIVLLDMSMDVSDPRNRDNEALQDYLATAPDGTRPMIVSGVLTTQGVEVRDLIVKVGAIDLIFKQEITPDLLRTRLAAALDRVELSRQQLVDVSRRVMVPPGIFENEVLLALRPKGGTEGLHAALQALLDVVGPIAPHLDRPTMECTIGGVMGVCWSRSRGSAVLVGMFQAPARHADVASMPDLSSRVTSWIGFAPSGLVILDLAVSGVRVVCWEEADLEDDHFRLPVVSRPRP